MVAPITLGSDWDEHYVLDRGRKRGVVQWKLRGEAWVCAPRGIVDAAYAMQKEHHGM